ncbi:hypothetical protein BC938DRAFT_472128 [Jimgerdemannia flammicorona]|uniref:Uncharacterized protein n=1 Tax=Jimgerdemannia flammicorona TaxID=994334 RepID=A0A433Q6T7_9FUNG|nr:hypothetical protein BC938DRAFT_472128 [Jimgerdemannia flammicorona]
MGLHHRWNYTGMVDEHHLIWRDWQEREWCRCGGQMQELEVLCRQGKQCWSSALCTSMAAHGTYGTSRLHPIHDLPFELANITYYFDSDNHDTHSP